LDIVAYLKNKNIKITKARISIFEILIENDFPINAESIFELCRKKYSNINISTVYRTLDIFVKNGIVNKFDLGRGKYSYILKNRGHKHVVQCQLCNKKVEYDCVMPQIKEILKKETGFTLLSGELVLNAICDDCKNKNDCNEEN